MAISVSAVVPVSQEGDTKFIFVRHGQTEWNVEGRCQGWLDSELTASGKAGAISIGKRLRAMNEKSSDFHYDAVYSSPLGRAATTAKLALSQFGDRNKKHFMKLLKYDDRLKERYAAEFQGQLNSTFEQDFAHSTDIDAKPVPDAESRADLLKRIHEFLDEKIVEHAGQTILIFGHGILIGTLLTSLIMDGFAPKKFPHTLSIPNCSINIIEHSADSGKWVVRRVGDNDTSVIDLMESSYKMAVASAESEMDSSFLMTGPRRLSPLGSSRVPSSHEVTEKTMDSSSYRMNQLLLAGVMLGVGVLIGLRFARQSRQIAP